MPDGCFAGDYVRIKIFPEHVGVFTVDGKQQFVAFGYLANGASVNITQQVDWESTNKNIFTIDDKGLAIIVRGRTYGKARVICSYPKTVKIPVALSAINLLLLGSEPKPRARALSAINLLLL
jgi:hypothetical protein